MGTSLSFARVFGACNVLVTIVKKELHLDCSLYQILQILSISLFEKAPIQQALTSNYSQNDKTCNPNQLVLSDL